MDRILSEIRETPFGSRATVDPAPVAAVPLKPCPARPPAGPAARTHDTDETRGASPPTALSVGAGGSSGLLPRRA